MLAHMRLVVKRLRRLDFGPYALGTLPKGAVLEVPVKERGVGGYTPRLLWGEGGERAGT